jgi:hypothetical protein
MPIKLATTGRNSAVDSITALINAGGAGTIKIYNGAQPANPQTALSGQTLLGTLTFSATSFGAGATGVATANSITQDSSADASGTASWARIASGGGSTVFDCDVTGTGGGGTIQLNTTTIAAGGPIQISSFTLTMPE